MLPADLGLNPTPQVRTQQCWKMLTALEAHPMYLFLLFSQRYPFEGLYNEDDSVWESILGGKFSREYHTYMYTYM